MASKRASESDEPEAPVRASSATAEQLLALIDQMPVGERERLVRIGATFPVGVEAAIDGGLTHKFGYRCGACGRVALYFCGTRFGPKGDAASPPLNIALSQLPWTQNLPSEQIDRVNPRCQNCFTRVPLNNLGGILSTHLIPTQAMIRGGDPKQGVDFGGPIKDVNEWEVRRDEQFTGKKIEEVADRLARQAPDLQGVNNAYDAPDTPLMNDGDRQMIQALDEQVDLVGGLHDALRGSR